MPLLLCPEYNFPRVRAYNEDLGVAELRYVEDWVIGFFVVGAEKRATRGSCAIPRVGFRGCLLGKLVGILQVGDRLWRSRGVVGCSFYFESPEMGDEAGPEATCVLC